MNQKYMDIIPFLRQFHKKYGLDIMENMGSCFRINNDIDRALIAKLTNNDNKFIIIFQFVEEQDFVQLDQITTSTL